MIKTLTFLGHSTAEFEGVTVASADYGAVEARRSDDEIALRDGALNGSRADGRLRYKSRTLTYVLNVLASPADIEGRLSALREWLSSGCGDLTDGFNEGWKFTNADFLSAKVDYIDMFRGAAQMTVRFTADPYMQSAGGTRTRVFKFTAQGDTAFHVIDNSYIFMPEWSAVPVSTGSGIFVNIPESGGMGTQYFVLSGIPEGAEVTSATVTKDGESGGTISMIGNDSGSLYLAEKGATISIAYSEEVSSTDCTGGHSAAVYSAEAPYTYRLKAFTEGTPSVRLNGTLINISQPFTMPDRALITIQNTGYGYYELWHDTTEVRL